MFVTAAGMSHIPPHGRYPPARHPEGYNYEWPGMRVLKEFQCIFIVKGKGVFKTGATGSRAIKAGDMILLFPEVSHRYSPDPETGWDEYWVSFDGDAARGLLQRGVISPRAPIYETKLNHGVLRCYTQLLDMVRLEPIGIQPVAGALTSLILAQARSAHAASRVGGKYAEQMVHKATFYLEQNVNRTVSMRNMARTLGVGYSWLRQEFKRFTGVSLKHYQLQLRIGKSKDLLTNTSCTVKQIATILDFESPYYFMRLFKKKVGMTPRAWRNYSRGNRVETATT